MRPVRDPAPSRFAYRMNRLMLTPAFRRFLRYGLPCLVVAALVAGWASDAGRRQDALDRVAELRRQIEQRPEFMVRMMAVENATDGTAAEIRAMLPLDFPVSSFDLDLDEMRTTVEALDAVASASVRIRSGGVLDVEVVERQPVVVWRTENGLRLLDADGVRVAPLSERTGRADLPLIAGRGADDHVPEALRLLEVAAPVHGRLRALVRIGERRWDLVLDRGQRVRLPQEAPVTALEKVMALDAAQDLLARDIAIVDFRNPRRPVIRLTPDGHSSLQDSTWTISEDSTR